LAWNSNRVGKRTTDATHKLAGEIYTSVLESNAFLLVPLVLEVAPTRCRDDELRDTIEKILVQDKYNPIKYSLSPQGLEDLARTFGDKATGEKYGTLLKALSDGMSNCYDCYRTKVHDHQMALPGSAQVFTTSS
jgi:hypothetical protein